MSDYCATQENSCSRCIKNSPVASLIGFILVLIGAGTFGGATIFARRYLISAVNEPELATCLDYAIYALIGALGLFTILAYFVCAISSGNNAKHCFESSRKAACGRCCNMTLLLSLVLAILVWSVILCLLAYALVSIRLLHYRQSGPIRLLLAQEKSPNVVEMDGYAAEQFGTARTLHRVKRKQSFSDESMNDYNRYDIVRPEPIDPNLMESSNPYENVDRYTPQTSDPGNTHSDWAGSHNRSEIARMPSDTVKKTLKAFVNPLVQGLNGAEALFYRCDENTIDLSYYGLYDSKGMPLRLPRKEMEATMPSVFLCACIATAGIFLVLLGYVQITICTAMNYARLQEKRYYEISEAGEEGVALNQ